MKQLKVLQVLIHLNVKLSIEFMIVVPMFCIE